MPGIEDWKTKPYNTIQQIFDENSGISHEVFVKKIEEYFTLRLTGNALKTLPSVNCSSLEQLRSGALVKYRCMVQDVFDPQYFVSRYAVNNKDGGASRVECGSFRDMPQLQPSETADFSGSHSDTVERQSYYCVPIPGESSWVKEICNNSNKRVAPSTSYSPSREKRNRDEEEACDMETDQKITKEGELMVQTNGNTRSQAEQKLGNGFSASGTTTAATSSTLPTLNMPLPGEKGIPCIVRVYSGEVQLKATDAVEIVGVLCMDPRLASLYDEDGESNDITEREELQAHEPPASLVPRLHALVIQKLQHNNPNLSSVVGSDLCKQAIASLMMDACSLRLEMLSVLEHALLGDRLAAEYVLCQLLSTVYARVDVLPLGKLCVNLSRCPTAPRYTKFLHHLISQLTTQSVFLEMSIDNMNMMTLVPKKDYSQNRIRAGMLQLAPGTTMVLDETALQQGQLATQGVSNVKALAELIKWQRVDYDFQWHPIPVHSDVGVLVLSEGESLLPKDVHVPLTAPVNHLDWDVCDHFSKLDSRLTPENLEKLRMYITASRLTEYSVDDVTQKMIQDDFVETRQSNPNNMTVEDFQTLLGLLRLICLSYGKSSPTVDMWRAAKSMEEARKERVSQLPAAASPRPTL